MPQSPHAGSDGRIQTRDPNTWICEYERVHMRMVHMRMVHMRMVHMRMVHMHMVHMHMVHMPEPGSARIPRLASRASDPI